MARSRSVMFARWLDGEAVRGVDDPDGSVIVEAWRNGAWVPLAGATFESAMSAESLVNELLEKVSLPWEKIWEV